MAHVVSFHCYKSADLSQKLWKAIEGFSAEERCESISLLENSLRQHCAEVEGDKRLIGPLVDSLQLGGKEEGLNKGIAIQLMKRAGWRDSWLTS